MLNYFEQEINETVNGILRYSNGPCLILNVVTDTHYNPFDENNVRRTEDTCNNLCTLNEKVFIHGIVHMGDVSIHGQPSFTEEVSSQHINLIRSRMLKANRNVFMINGNHDGLGGSVPTTSNYNCMAAQSAHLTVREGNKPYCYADFDFVKVRAIFLSTNTAEETDVWGISDVQLNWIRRALLSAPSDYGILIFSHIGTFCVEDFSTNRDEVVRLFNEYHTHTGAFAGRTGKCIAWCCGHEHFDWVVPTSHSGLLFPEIVVTSSLMHGFYPDPALGYEGYVNPPRVDRTKDQDAWDTLIYRPDINKLYMVRFGSGEDRVIDLEEWK